MSETYSNVDASARVDEALAWQDRVDAWPQIQATLRITVPGAPAKLVDTVTRLRAEIGYRNGLFVREIRRLLENRGLDVYTVDEFPLVLTDPDDAFGLPTWVDYWRAEGGFDDADVRTWDTSLQRAREEGGFEYSLQYVVVSATR